MAKNELQNEPIRSWKSLKMIMGRRNLQRRRPDWKNLRVSTMKGSRKRKKKNLRIQVNSISRRYGAHPYLFARQAPLNAATFTFSIAPRLIAMEQAPSTTLRVFKCSLFPVHLHQVHLPHQQKPSRLLRSTIVLFLLAKNYYQILVMEGVVMAERIVSGLPSPQSEMTWRH